MEPYALFCVSHAHFPVLTNHTIVERTNLRKFMKAIASLVSGPEATLAFTVATINKVTINH